MLEENFDWNYYNDTEKEKILELVRLLDETANYIYHPYGLWAVVTQSGVDIFVKTVGSDLKTRFPMLKFSYNSLPKGSDIKKMLFIAERFEGIVRECIPRDKMKEWTALYKTRDFGGLF
jgi:hypothetical protein